MEIHYSNLKADDTAELLEVYNDEVTAEVTRRIARCTYCVQ